MRFEVMKVIAMKIRVFWTDAASTCKSLLTLGGSYCHLAQGVVVLDYCQDRKAAVSFEMSLTVNTSLHGVISKTTDVNK